MKNVKLYTDGACSGNPGPGGYGFVLIYGDHKKEGSGSEPNTTNNRMEITAVIEGLKCLKEACEVDIYSDSQYVCKAFTEHWIDNWIKKNWKKVKNVDLWQKLLSQLEPHKYKFIWVRGHADNEYNNRCDELATNAI
ncbi:MAG: ribonuclease HI [Coriobacteriia bacterium]|nr:ribonuclease HI [Coriobacteriia bacterium]